MLILARGLSRGRLRLILALLFLMGAVVVLGMVIYYPLGGQTGKPDVGTIVDENVSLEGIKEYRLDLSKYEAVQISVNATKLVNLQIYGPNGTVTPMRGYNLQTGDYSFMAESSGRYVINVINTYAARGPISANIRIDVTPGFLETEE